ncbi:hypothetical protein [Abditibacterium utsteinense]|nr:hypothetical protein [Abditibacterium utsteinense]
MNHKIEGIKKQTKRNTEGARLIISSKLLVPKRLAAQALRARIV